ncbi:MAG: enoyl-CoA hydratase/isomerase family protein, partial [Candidatus Eremiobacteraeota bacterium]|nr:enoyl-CoA hydratase/isomerase family protein [Candidatus Eremiobacteraeota bacterium]
MLETILLDRNSEHVATITLNRPKVLNALNAQLITELRTTLEELDNDEQIRAIVITGSGDRAFAAGADIGELNAI